MKQGKKRKIRRERGMRIGAGVKRIKERDTTGMKEEEEERGRAGKEKLIKA